MRIRKTVAGLLGALLLASTPLPASADGFSFTFEWGDIPLCTSGYPNSVTNPIFTVNNVPEGTIKIFFKLKDRNAMQFDHGGGSVKYAGQNVIGPGAFDYKQPCPPSGSHTYEWTAQAKAPGFKTLAEAKASKKYP